MQIKKPIIAAIQGFAVSPFSLIVRVLIRLSLVEGLSLL